MTSTTGLETIVQGCPSTMGDDFQLNTTTLIRHAVRTHGDQEIVYRTPDGGWDRYSYRDSYVRICRTANALRKLGVGPGDRVGILDWNSRRHFELYFAIPGLGAAMLQMNLRLGTEDLGYVVGHSQAALVLVDESLLSVAEAIAPHVPGVKGWVVMTDKPLSEISTTLSPLYHHEDLLAAADNGIDWPVIDERSAYSACYTTGTTGRPKGGLLLAPCDLPAFDVAGVECWHGSGRLHDAAHANVPRPMLGPAAGGGADGQQDRAARSLHGGGHGAADGRDHRRGRNCDLRRAGDFPADAQLHRDLADQA